MHHPSSIDATIATIDKVDLDVTLIDLTREEAEIAEMLDVMEAEMAVVMAVGATEEVALVDIVIETETMSVTVRDSSIEEKAKMVKIKS